MATRSNDLVGTSETGGERSRSDWTEIVATIILTLATVASAWSGYQANRWSGIMTIRYSEAAAARTLGAQAHTRAGQLVHIDIATFLTWAEAVATEDRVLEEFMHARFRPEMKVAFEAWLDTHPITNRDPDAPPTPFGMEEYRLEEVQRGDSLLAAADEKVATAKTANQIGDSYVLTTVLFASVLFFAGIATKFTDDRLKRALVALGLIAFLLGTVIIARFPVF